MSNEVDGRTAATAHATAIALPPSSADNGTSVDSITAKPKPRGAGKPFAPGHDTRRNAAGRPKKGESFADKYRKRLEKDADALIEAHVVRAQGKGAVAARDFELAAAYAMGRPQQKYVVETQDSPLLAFLQRHTAELPYVEGEARLLPADDADVRT